MTGPGGGAARSVVTGAAGFIGSHLVDALLAAGDEVVGIDSFTDYYAAAAKEANLAAALRHPRFTLLRRDLLELATPGAGLRDAFAGASRVFHLAAQAGVRGSWGESFRVYSDNNVLATQAVLETCVAAGVPSLVYASSSSVYGDVDELPLREDGPLSPVSPYGVTKLAGEQLARLYGNGRGLHVVTLRFFTVFGPRQRPDMAFHKFMRALLDDQVIDLYGNGSQTRDFTYVADIVAGIVTAADAPGGSVINLGGGHRVTLLEAVAALAGVAGKEPRLREQPVQTGDARDTWADLSRARELLGYAPATSLADGLAAEWVWLRSQES